MSCLGQSKLYIKSLDFFSLLEYKNMINYHLLYSKTQNDAMALS